MTISIKQSGETVQGYSTNMILSITGNTFNIQQDLLNLDFSVREDILSQLERAVEELKKQKELLK